MTTIDKIDGEWYQEYARAVQEMETTFKNLRIGSLQEARVVQPHTWVESLDIKVPLVDLLLGLYSPDRKTIAFFTKPFSTQRRSPFGYFLIAPSLGTLEQQEEDAEKIRRVRIMDEEREGESGEEEESEDKGKQSAATNKSRIEKRRKSALEEMYELLQDLNGWLLEIKGKQAQYQKG